MCQLCQDVMKRLPHEGDVELTEAEFAELFELAESVSLIPGGHVVGVGITGRSRAE